MLSKELENVNQKYEMNLEMNQSKIRNKIGINNK